MKSNSFKLRFTIVILIIFCLNLSCVQSDDNTKVIIVNLNISNDIVTHINTIVKYSHPSNNFLEHEFFNVRLISIDDDIINEYGIWDPRISFGDELALYENGTVGPLESRIFYDDYVNFSIIIPFCKNIKQLDLFNYSTNEKLISVFLRDSIIDFCENNPNDSGCSEFISIPQTIIIVLIVIITLVLIFLLYKRK